MNLPQIEAFVSQTIGGGSAGALQAGSAFTAGVTALQGDLNAKFASLGGVLGTFGLAGGLNSASQAATASSTAQEQALLSSLKANWIYLVPVALIFGFLLMRRR